MARASSAAPPKVIAPPLRAVEPHQQFDHARLAGAGCADQRQSSAFGQGQVDAVENVCICLGVAESHVLQGQVPPLGQRGGAGRIADRRRDFRERLQAARRGCRLAIELGGLNQGRSGFKEGEGDEAGEG